MKRRLRLIAFFLIGALGITLFGATGFESKAFDQNHIDDAIKLIYETDEVTLRGIKVRQNNESGELITDTLSFTLFDSTIQEFAGTLVAKGGEIQPKKLIKGHHYITWLNPNDKWMIREDYNQGTATKRYFTLLSDVNPNNIATYPTDDKRYANSAATVNKPITAIALKAGKTKANTDMREYVSVSRLGYGIGVYDAKRGYFVDLNDDLGGAKIKLINQYDTITCDDDGDGTLIANCIEDLNYVPVISGGNGKYKMLSTLITTKDHSERPDPTLTYTHYTCFMMSAFMVTDDNDYYNRFKYAPFTSMSGKSSLDGVVAFIRSDTAAGKEINNGSDGIEFLFRERELLDYQINDSKLTGKSYGTDYVVMDFDTLNMHRNEVSKLPYGDYTITTKLDIPSGKVVDKVYNIKTKLDSDYNEVYAGLEECSIISQSTNKLSFKTKSVSCYNTLITFKKPEPKPAPVVIKKNQVIKPSTDKKASYKVTDTSSKKAAVTFKKSSSTASKLTIPATIKDVNGKSYKVTAIAKNALKNNKKLTNITIGKNVTTIGEGAFYNNTKLSNVKLGDKVSKLGKKAFYKDKKLSSITINGNALKSVGKNAFYGVKKNCKITIKAKNRTQYNKIVKMIKKSGAKNVKYVYKKK